MTPARLLGPMAMSASLLLYGLSLDLTGDADPFAWQAAAGLLLAGAALTAWQGRDLAMSWLRGLIPQREGDFSTAPPARRVTIRIRCHR